MGCKHSAIYKSLTPHPQWSVSVLDQWTTAEKSVWIQVKNCYENNWLSFWGRGKILKLHLMSLPATNTSSFTKVLQREHIKATSVREKITPQDGLQKSLQGQTSWRNSQTEIFKMFLKKGVRYGITFPRLFLSLWMTVYSLYLALNM